MSKFKSDFLNVLSERGFIHQISDAEALDQAALKGSISAYIGFDATAASLHAGSLVQIMMLRWLQKTGHRPIALMGGGTTRIGDPSGRDESRKLLTDAQIEANLAGIRQVFGKFLVFGEGPGDALMVNNAEWLDRLNYIEFLRDYGVHFTINKMLAFDSVKLRLEREQPLTFLEFNYMILQAYDFLELSRRHDCVLQMGGSDQWGNIINGMELGRRVDARQLFALTTPLLATSSGAKMGKTAAGAVWLNPDMLSPYDYWQYWRNCEDGDVGRFLRLYTELPMAEIARLASLGGAEINEAKKTLASEATAMLHGRASSEQAEATARQTFEGSGSAEGLPTFRMDLRQGTGLLTALVTAGLASSNSEARRHIQAGSVRINDQVVRDEKLFLRLNFLGHRDFIKLSVGKKKHVLIKAL